MTAKGWEPSSELDAAQIGVEPNLLIFCAAADDRFAASLTLLSWVLYV